MAPGQRRGVFENCQFFKEEPLALCLPIDFV